MKSAEMSNESTMNVYNNRRSNRPSVAAKMSQLANDSGDISYDSVLRIVGDEIDAEKKSKMLLRTSLMLLFSLLALTAANAGLTFAVVEFAKETSVSGDVMTVKGTDTVVKTSSADFQLVDGRMMTAGASPAPVATIGEQLSGIPAEDLMFAAAMDLSVLGQVDSLELESETGAVRSFVITGHTLDDEMNGVTFHTAAGVDVTINGDGDVEVDDTENSRSLLKGKKSYKRNNVFFAWKRRMQKHYWKRRILSLNTRFSGGFSSNGNDEAIAKNVVVKAAQLPAPAKANKDNVGAISFDFSKSALKFDATAGRWSGSGSGDRRHLSAFGALRADAYVYEPFTQKYAGAGSGSGSRFYYQFLQRKPAPPTWAREMPRAAAYGCAAYPSNDANGYYCENVDAFSYMSYDDLGVTNNPGGNNWLCDMWGYESAGRQFVLQSTTNSVAFVEVTDPNNPYVVGTHMLDGFDYQWYWSGFPKYNIISDVKVIGDNGYFVSWRYKSSIAKMDLTQLLGASAGTDFVHGSHLTAYRPCCHFNFFGKWVKYLAAHNIVAFSNLILSLWTSPTYVGFNYACTAGDGGVMILDAYDPANQVGCISESGKRGFGGDGRKQNVGAPHDAVCHDYGKSQTCFLAGGYSGKLSAVDVSPLVAGKSANLRVTSQVTVVGHSKKWTCSWSSTGKCSDMIHQVDVDSSGSFMVVTDEFDEVNSKIFGTKAYNMRLRTYSYSSSKGLYNGNLIDTGRSETRDHQGYIYDSYYFLAAVRAGVIFYQRNGNSLNEVGIFDTHPDNTSLSQFGAWTVFAFPYVKCGNTYYLTAISDMAGLHLVQPAFKKGDGRCRSFVPPDRLGAFVIAGKGMPIRK